MICFDDANLNYLCKLGNDHQERHFVTEHDVPEDHVQAVPGGTRTEQRNRRSKEQDEIEA